MSVGPQFQAATNRAARQGERQRNSRETLNLDKKKTPGREETIGGPACLRGPTLAAAGPADRRKAVQRNGLLALGARAFVLFVALGQRSRDARLKINSTPTFRFETLLSYVVVTAKKRCFVSYVHLLRNQLKTPR